MQIHELLGMSKAEVCMAFGVSLAEYQQESLIGFPSNRFIGACVGFITYLLRHEVALSDIRNVLKARSDACDSCRMPCEGSKRQADVDLLLNLSELYKHDAT